MPDSAFEIIDANPGGRGRSARLAALKEGLPADKRALAEDLRALFGALGVSVRRYAVRRHLDASSVTRYLSGDRVPPWDFVAGLIGDVREASAPLTPQAEAALRETHRAALKANRRSSAMQELQDELAGADEETRRIRTRERALEQALHDRERSLSESVSRSRHLEMELDNRQLAHRTDVALWEGEYEQLRRDCDDLREEMLHLQEALAVTRAELIAAEVQCNRLEAELDAMAGLEGRAEGASSLMAALEAANRTSSVAELVNVVGDLEARTQQAMARELVSAASRSRRVEDVAALLSGLEQAGLHAHAVSAVPALVMTRPVTETAALAGELHRSGFEDGVAAVLRSSVELKSPCDIIGLCLGLHRGGQGELAESLLTAAFVVRTVTDVVAVAVWAAGTEVEPASLSALGPAVDQRSAQELVELTIALRAAGRHKHADSLPVAVAERCEAMNVVSVIECFTAKGMTGEADFTLSATQGRGVSHVLALVRALVQGKHSEAAASVVDLAVRHRPVEYIATMIADLYSTNHFPQAAQALMASMRHSGVSTRFLLRYLDETYPGAEAVVEMVVATGSPERAAHLLTCLEGAELPLLAEVVFQQTLREKPTGHAGLFLDVLDRSSAAVVREADLYARACAAQGPDMAPLLLALTAAGGLPARDAVVHGCISNGDVSELVMLLRQLHNLDHPIRPRVMGVVDRIMVAVTQSWPMVRQATLLMSLSDAGLTDDADRLARRAADQPKFKGILKKEQTKHEQKVLSRAFWGKSSHGRDGERNTP
ncbi:hypothetical protein [Streptomyces sp. NP-1717]|uniref:hypothetical protein n=1 Tax=Streptomyces sp. NP-1717 TaxID=2704470 RepID=UPI001F5C1D16|nr:hypothetical protein [Streptomyces sp. NP-1717]MCI3220778.1 hypothetical protein [Streptomyces sp. NP-1717]